jgi:hypothetical protein
LYCGCLAANFLQNYYNLTDNKNAERERNLRFTLKKQEKDFVIPVKIYTFATRIVWK